MERKVKPIIFEGREVKVGDRMWSVVSGWGVVSDLNSEKEHKIKLKHDDDLHSTYTAEGLYISDRGVRCLFWDEVKIDPPKPKTKRWCWARKTKGGETIITPHLSHSGFLEAYPDTVDYTRLDWTEVES
jgi:hypothetical protein